MTSVCIGLGSNLGHRQGNIAAAVRHLGAAGGIEVVRVSSLWESAPVPDDQPPYLNAVVLVEWPGRLEDLLPSLKRIEHKLGRRPGRRWGPRPIDLDILASGDVIMDTPELTVPHPRIFERAFVLAPLLEVLERDSELYARCVERLRKIGLSGLRRV